MTSALDALYWRGEVLQALYWMRGEGIATRVSAARLAEFLVADRATLSCQLADLVADGYLELQGGDYQLTAMGVKEGGRGFQDEFGDLTRAAHYECGPGCWCQDPAHTGEQCPNR